MRFPGLLLCLALAGCLAAPPVDPGAAGPDPVSRALSLACPGGAPSAEPCFSVLDLGHEGIAEPFLAAHRTDPSIFALGVNNAPALADYAAGVPADRADFTRVGVFLTKDAGQTWRRAFPEPPRGAGPGLHPLSIRADPVLIFDAAGVLHFTALASAGTPLQFAHFLGVPGDNGIRTYYARSADLGRTWTDLRVLDDNGLFQDRNWMAYDPASGLLYTLWQNIPGDRGLPGRTVEVAWSEDSGVTWKTQPAADQAPCYRAGDITLRGGLLLFACSQGEAAPETVALYSFDAATGRSSLLGALPVGEHWPAVTTLPGDRLLLRTQRCFQEAQCGQESMLRLSDDGGATWSEPALLSELAASAAEGIHVMWLTFGPDGAIHVLAAATRPFGDATPALELRATEHTTLHLALSTDLVPRSVTELTRWTDETTRGPPRLATIANGDHFHGMAFGPQGGLVAVTVDAAVWVTALR